YGSKETIKQCKQKAKDRCKFFATTSRL
ncbi:hypothetical protein A2U01_0108987, partial [Trifolium medium]|nr:hypothetical protein [Trifolium medium]